MNLCASLEEEADLSKAARSANVSSITRKMAMGTSGGLNKMEL